MPKVLVFDIWGDYAHFKKPYTITSPLTYSIPSRTTITGIIGAILGIEKNENNIMLSPENANISLSILSPIRKTRIAENLINTKGKKFRIHNGRTQIKIEFLVNPKYRIYIEIKDDTLNNKLKDLLENHKSIYTPTLGLSENIANFKFIGEFDYENKKPERNKEYEINSVIRIDNVDNKCIIIESDKEYFTDTFSRIMSKDRIVEEYSKVLFERNGKTIKIVNLEFIKLYSINEKNENIIWI